MDNFNENFNKEKLKSLFEIQLSELEMLQSVFCNAGEIRLDDYSTIADMTDYINGKTDVLPLTLDFTVKPSIYNFNFELCVTFPHDYPETEPEIFVRNNKQNRNEQRKINNDLTEYIKSLQRGDPCIYTAITWLQDNAEKYMSVEIEPKKPKNKVCSNECARFWIYSHHIYSKTKRREILNLANEYSLTGFCLPGKPGVVCVEGLAEDCNQWWIFIKSMCWKKIVCKFVENGNGGDVDEFRKFKKFEELAFQCEGNRGNHMNLGDLLKYLEEHNSGHMFNELFGLEAKNA